MHKGVSSCPSALTKVRSNRGGTAKLLFRVAPLRYVARCAEYAKRLPIATALYMPEHAVMAKRVSRREYPQLRAFSDGRAFDEIAPPDRDYAHNLRWGDGNGHSHVRAALLGPSLTVPFVNGELQLGTWQQITFVDFDNRSRSRRLVVQVMGE